MKKYSTILLILLIAFSTSCEDFLNQYPTSEISDLNLPKDSTSVQMLLNGVYSALQATVTNEWAVTELRSDNARIHAHTNVVIYTYVLELDLGNTSTINTFVEDYWKDTYDAIYRSNFALEFIDNTPEYSTKEGHRSELRTLRAHHYFNLVRNWGPVFLVTKPTSGEEARYQQRESVDKVYDFIENELIDVINSESLPVRHNNSALGRVNIMFAKSLLAKVYMTRFQPHDSGYLKAKPLLEDVIEGIGNPTSYTDLVPYNEIFDINNEMNEEIIFAVRFSSGNLGIGSSLGNDFAPSFSGDNVIFGQGRSFNYPTQDVINAFEPGDARKDVTLQERYYRKETGIWVENDGVQVSRYVNKFLSPVTVRNDGENDFPVMRVGDVLLLYAELLNEEGDIYTSLDYLNLVRERASLSPYSPSVINNQYTLRQAIRQERRVELAFENQRWYDLMRWGIAVETVNKQFAASSFYPRLPGSVNAELFEWSTILPLPLIVMTINPELPQNYGY